MAIIARHFCHLILLSCILVQYASTTNETEYISCTARCRQLTLRFANPQAIAEQCQENNSEESIYVNALTCGITYRIDYDRQAVYVDFTATNDTSDSDEPKPTESLHQTVRWNLDDQSGYNSGEITRRYSCSSKKDCAREHYLESITALVNDGKEKLDAIKDKVYNRTAIVGPHSRRRCTDSRKTGNKTSMSCREGFCHARLETYALDEEKNSKTQGCQRTHSAYLLSEIQRHSPKSTSDKEVLEFFCNKNVCNRNDLIPKIKSLLEEYTQRKGDEQEEATPAGADAAADDDTAAATPKSAPSLATKGTLCSTLLLSCVILKRFFN